MRPSAQKRVPQEQLAVVQRDPLEVEMTIYLEKVELLLRSFRNAREISAGPETFDLEYEREQARKLLAMSARLRRAAEVRGSGSATEPLHRVAPYLLEIANLGAHPSARTVAELQARVSDEHLIASVQVYSAR